jgi:hypothetical protein
LLDVVQALGDQLVVQLGDVNAIHGKKILLLLVISDDRW